MSLSLSTLIVASILQPGAAQEPAAFTRTYALKEQTVYSMTMDAKPFGSATATIVLDVLKFWPDKTPQVLFRTTKVVDVAPMKTSRLPEDQSCLIGKNNLPVSIRIMGPSALYLYLVAASPTPDKAIKVGDEVPMNISFPDAQIELKGKGKFVSADTAKRTATIEWTYKHFMQGKELANLRFTSTYDQTNYSLVKSTGRFDLGDPNEVIMSVSIAKVVATKAAK